MAGAGFKSRVTWLWSHSFNATLQGCSFFRIESYRLRCVAKMDFPVTPASSIMLCLLILLECGTVQSIHSWLDVAPGVIHVSLGVLFKWAVCGGLILEVVFHTMWRLEGQLGTPCNENKMLAALLKVTNCHQDPRAEDLAHSCSPSLALWCSMGLCDCPSLPPWVSVSRLAMGTSWAEPRDLSGVITSHLSDSAGTLRTFEDLGSSPCWDSSPVGDTSSLPCNLGQLYCFSLAQNVEGPQIRRASTSWWEF
jgi:hypothetical protein